MNLPLLNACLNGTAGILLLAGYVFIRQGRQTPHRRCMAAAFAVSCAFLASYLYHKIFVVRGVNTPFRGPASLRPFYLTLLISHVFLAILIVPMALRTGWLAWRGHLVRHRSLARWTWPLWMYVSVTGVLVYIVLYVLWPA